MSGSLKENGLSRPESSAWEWADWLTYDVSRSSPLRIGCPSLACWLEGAEPVCECVLGRGKERGESEIQAGRTEPTSPKKCAKTGPSEPPDPRMLSMRTILLCLCNLGGCG